MYLAGNKKHPNFEWGERGEGWEGLLFFVPLFTIFEDSV